MQAATAETSVSCMGILDRQLDLYALKRDFEQVNHLLDTIRESTDARFLRAARRAFFPLPVLDRDEPPALADALPARRSRPLPALSGKRIAVVAGGGGGSCVALIGAVRAFEEAGIEPAEIVSCSGGTIWGSMWAAGLTSDEMAEFSLSWRPEDYLDMQWLKFPRFAALAFRGFSGAMKGEAIERLFNDRFGGLPAGDFKIPLAPIVYDIDRGQVEYFGTQSTPDVTIGRLVRIAIALPLMIEAVPVHGHLYMDGGIVDLLPMQPIIDDGEFDHTFALNFMLPPQLEPPDISGWQDTSFGILKASRQLEQGYHLEFAQRARDILGDSLTVVDAADYRNCRGVPFYEFFVDRSHWPALIRDGYRRTVAALDRFREPADYAMAGASGSRASASSMSDSENSGSSRSPDR